MVNRTNIEKIKWKKKTTWNQKYYQYFPSISAVMHKMWWLIDDYWLCWVFSTNCELIVSTDKVRNDKNKLQSKSTWPSLSLKQTYHVSPQLKSSLKLQCFVSIKLSEEKRVGSPTVYVVLVNKAKIRSLSHLFRYNVAKKKCFPWN